MSAVTEHATLREAWEAQVRARPDAEFLVVEDSDAGTVERYTYRQFADEVSRAANLFLSLGVDKGDRVAVHLRNRTEFVECFLALASIGAVIVPLNTSHTARECRYVLDQCEVDLLVTEPALYARKGMRGMVARVVVVDDGPRGYAALKRGTTARSERRPDLGAEDLVEIMYTSGTTSDPKGVMLTNANMVFSGRYVNWELAMTGRDRYLTSMSATHVNFQLSALVPVITAGCTLILQRRYSATRLWEQVRTHGATLLQAMAMLVRTLLSQPVAPGERDHGLREVHYFLPLPTAQKEEFERRFGVRILNNYGSTESLVGVVTDPPTGPRRWPSIGRPGPGYAVRIVGPDGRELPVGQCGEIQVRGEPGVSLMAGYWRNPEASAEAIVDGGWLRTGDAGYVDGDGWVYFTDRLGDLIKRAGENISAAQIEDTLLEHPAIAEVAVVGVPDPVRDEAVKAVIVPVAGSDLRAQDVTRFAAERLACFKIPTIIEFRAQLPRGEYGKVRKGLLTHQERLCNDDQD